MWWDIPWDDLKLLNTGKGKNNGLKLFEFNLVNDDKSVYAVGKNIKKSIYKLPDTRVMVLRIYNPVWNRYYIQNNSTGSRLVQGLASQCYEVGLDRCIANGIFFQSAIFI